MVYASQQRIEEIPEQPELSALFEPAVLKAAQQIYRNYYEVNFDRLQRPLGVALNRYTFRGKLIFSRKPILLPQECFIPFNQIEAELF